MWRSEDPVPVPDLIGRPVLACAVLLYLGGFLLSYVQSFSPFFGYMGFRYVTPPIGSLALSWGLAMAPVLWLPRRLARPSFVVLWLLYLIVYIPSMTIPVYCGIAEHTPYLAFAVSLAAGFAVSGLIASLNHAQPTWRFEGRALAWLLGGLTLATYSGIFLQLGVHFDFSRAADVYGLREDYVAQMARSGRWLGYAVPWQGNVVNPSLLAVGLTEHRPWLLVLGIAGQIIIFLLAGFRAALLSLPLMLILYFALRKDGGRRFAFRANLCLALALVAGMVEKWITGTAILMGLLQQRTLGMPGMLSGQYVEFYSTHPKAHLGYGLLKGIVGHPYFLQPAETIGDHYAGLSGIFANANLWADAYANFGLPAVLVASLLLGLVLWVMDHAALGKNPLLAGLIVAMPAITLSNTSLLTGLFTQGVGLSLLLIALLPMRPGDLGHA